MLKLKLEDLHVPANRQRQEFDAEGLQKLATSIEQFGLFNALRVRPREEGGFWLVQGERRLRAVRDYVWPTGGALRYAGEYYDEGTIPCIDFGALDPLAAEEFELSENIDRADYTWQERAAATARIADIRKRIAERDGTPGPSVATIAAEVRGSSGGSAHQATRREVIVAQHLDDPEVAGAATLDEAFKVLKRKEEVAKNTAIAAEVGATFTAELHAAHNVDAVAWLAKAPAESFDVILTDPPYGMGADDFGDQGGLGGIIGGQHRYEDSTENWRRLSEALVTQSYRVAKKEAHLYCFCDVDRFQDLKNWFASHGWWVHRTPLIWHKPGNVRVPWPEHGPQRKYELILYAVKGKRRVTKIFPDVVSYNPDDNLGHQAQKPVGLFIDLLKRSVNPGDTVLDPFMGTGTVFPAAHELKCRATGIELDPAAYGIALKRLEQLKAQRELGL
jgi:site-specific DNA-methyltransferase (adenine-specific)